MEGDQQQYINIQTCATPRCCEGEFLPKACTRVTGASRPLQLAPRKLGSQIKMVGVHPELCIQSSASKAAGLPIPWHRGPHATTLQQQCPEYQDAPRRLPHRAPSRQRRHVPRAWPSERPAETSAPHPKLPKHHRPGPPSRAQLQYWPTPCQLFCAVMLTFRLGLAHRAAKMVQLQSCSTCHQRWQSDALGRAHR